MTAATISFAEPPEPWLVSVIIPTYNRAHIVGRAIESALHQTYGHLEVIVVDDGSSDGTRALVSAMGSRVRYFHQANAGVSAARNHGMRQARGEFVAFLDSDDVWRPWKIAAQISALRRWPAATVAWTDMSAADDAGQLIRDRHLRVMYTAYNRIDVDTLLPTVGRVGDLVPGIPREWADAAVRTGDLSSAIMLGNLLHTSTVMFARKSLARSGGFDDAFPRTGEDYEFYVRLTSTGDVVLLDAPSVIYRIGAEHQLGGPAMMLEIARNDLRTLRQWLPERASRLSLPAPVIRKRISDSIEWVAHTELDAGHKWSAARHFIESLVTRPAFDRRAVWLAACALPVSARRALGAVRRRLARA